MNTRRDALKLMAVGLGSCVLPPIGLGQTTRSSRGVNIMGVDQCGGRLHYIFKQPMRMGVCGQCDFEHLPDLMHKYKINQCVIDQDPEGIEVASFARQFPYRVTPCRWTSQRLVNGCYKSPWGTCVPGKLLLCEGSFHSNRTVFAVKKAWDTHPRGIRQDDALLYLRIARYIQTGTHDVHCYP